MKPQITNQKPNLACPNCRQIDKVQKASAIWKSGTVHSNWSGTAVGGRSTSSYSGSGTRQTELAKVFSPPQKPFPKGIYFVLVGLVALIFFPIWAPASNANFHLGVAITSFFSNMGMILIKPPNSAGMFHVGAVIAAFLFGLGGFLICMHLIRLPNLRMQYRILVDRWQNLYYCSRCDNAFDSRN